MLGGALSVYAEGMLDMARGKDTPHAEAAAQCIARTVYLHHQWLMAHVEKK